MTWIDPNERLPEEETDVLVVIQDDIGLSYNVRWRSSCKDALMDKHGFVIYHPSEEVIAWQPIPYYPNIGWYED